MRNDEVWMAKVDRKTGKIGQYRLPPQEIPWWEQLTWAAGGIVVLIASWWGLV